MEVCATCRLSPRAAGENIAWSKVAGVEIRLRHELETGQKTAGREFDKIAYCTTCLRFEVTSPWFAWTGLFSIHDGALIHIFVRYDLESNSTQLSKHLTRKASFRPPGGIVRLTLTGRIRFRYIRLRALRRKAILQVFTGPAQTIMLL